MPQLSHRQLHHRLLLDRQTSEEVGHLSYLLLDPPSQTVVGLTCGGGLLSGSPQTYDWKQIHSIGDDSIVLDRQVDVRELSGSGPIKVPVGCELWTDGGNQIGKITDFVFDSETGAAIRYIFTTKGWQGMVDGTYQVPPIAISSVGQKRVILLEHLQSHIQQHEEGIGHKVNHVTEFLKADYEQTKEDIAHLKQTTQAAVDKVKDVLPHPKKEG